MSKPVKLTEIGIYQKCRECQKKYNVTAETRKAINKDIREVRCPYCDAIVGKVN